MSWTFYLLVCLLRLPAGVQVRSDLQESGRTQEQLHHREAHPSMDDASDLLNHKEFREQSYQQAMQRAPGLLFSVGITHTGYTCILVE